MTTNNNNNTSTAAAAAAAVPNIPLTEEDRRKVKEAFDEFSLSCNRVASEKDLQKGIIDELHDKYNIEKPLLRKLSKIHHDENLEEKVNTMSDIESLYKFIIDI